jgi:protein AroM
MAIHFGPGVEILERGALDGLSPEEVAQFRPDKGMFHLTTRLRDGSEVVVGKEKILPRIRDAVQELNTAGVTLILLLCNGEFPQFESDCLIIEPQRVVDHCIEGLLQNTHRLGLVVPVTEQVTWVHQIFEKITPHITVAVASPYADEDQLEIACREFQRAKCDLIALYCMGFNRRLGQKIRNLSGVPVLVSSSIVARTVGEILE